MEKAKQAKTENEIADELDTIKLAVVEAVALDRSGRVSKDNLETAFGKIPEVVDSANIIGEGPFSIVGKKTQTQYIIDVNGEVIKYGSTSEEETEMPKIPEGFVASQATGENKVETGLVIYEGTTPVTNSNVETARKTRNQFVWVPVDGENLEFEQDFTYKDVHQYEYKNHTWDDTIGKANKEKVKENKGFYIGRYEAGWETKTNGATYEKDNVKNTPSHTAVSRQGYAAWNYISETNAETVSNNMYSGRTDIKSQLIDSYAWDTTVKWLQSKGKIATTSTINSTEYGNYYTSNFSLTNVLHAKHTYNSGWTVATEYEIGNATAPNGSGTNRIELATGSYEKANLNNIYDMAGNMWEWTTEKDTTRNSNTYAAFRGGSFNSYGGSYPVVYRGGSSTTGGKNFDFGFRVVLYLQ